MRTPKRKTNTFFKQTRKRTFKKQFKKHLSRAEKKAIQKMAESKPTDGLYAANTETLAWMYGVDQYTVKKILEEDLSPPPHVISNARITLYDW